MQIHSKPFPSKLSCYKVFTYIPNYTGINNIISGLCTYIYFCNIEYIVITSATEGFIPIPGTITQAEPNVLAN